MDRGSPAGFFGLQRRVVRPSTLHQHRRIERRHGGQRTQHLRLSQRGGAVDASGVEAETAALAARDTAESTRAVAPLVAAPDAVPLDTNAMTFSDQVRFIVELARPIFGSR